MSKKEIEKKTKMVAVRFEPDEYEQLHQKSGNAPTSTVLRALAQGWLKGKIDVDLITGEITAKCS